MKRIFISLIVIVALFFSLSSCKEERTAVELMNEFLDSYGIESVIYSPSLSEGDVGYVDEKFFESVYGEASDSVIDYAAVFVTDTVSVGECAIFICASRYDAVVVSEICLMRIDMIASISGFSDTSSITGSFVTRNKNIVFMSVLSDNSRSKSAITRILK